MAGVAAWLLAAPALGVTDWESVGAGVVIAGAFAHGRLSPDMDRYKWLGKIIPGGHRGITHWWPIPLAVGWAALMYLETGYRFAVLAVAVAWASHILTDGVFGRVPVWPRGRSWKYAGLSLKTGGGVERWVAVPLFVVVAAWCLASYAGWHPAAPAIAAWT